MLQWLQFDKIPSRVEAYKLQISGYINRAEELKTAKPLVVES